MNEALRMLRVYHDLSQTELARRLEVSKSWISEIEKGTKEPTLQLLDSYARVFELPVSSILFFSEQLGNDGPVERARVGIAKKVLTLLRFIAERDEGESNAAGAAKVSG